MQELEVAIIGSGPAGLTAGIYLSRAKIKTTLFAGMEIGGQLMYTRDVENFPGFPDGMRGPEFMMRVQTQAKKFGTEIVYEQVTAVDFSQRPFKLWTNFPQGMNLEAFKKLRGRDLAAAIVQIKAQAQPKYLAKSVLVATGASSMMLGVPGESELLGKGVGVWAVCDAAFYKDKKVFVIGGGDSALEDALALTKFTDQVNLVHRRDSFRASKIMQDRVINNPKIKIWWNSSVKEIVGKNKVERIVLSVNGQEETFETDGVFVAIGHKPNTALFINELALDDRGYLLTRRHFSRAGMEMAKKGLNQAGLLDYPTMASVEGIFVAGDVSDYKYRQAVVAAGAGAMAALDAEKWLEEQSFKQ